MTTSVHRVRIRIEGVVQGVGFRPYVHRLATELGLAGFVCNDARGVVVEAEGESGAIDALLARLPVESPPMAVVDAVRPEVVPARNDAGFVIASSAPGSADALVSPDAATCEACQFHFHTHSIAQQ